MHLFELFRIWLSISAPRDLRVKFHSSNRHLAVGVLLHITNCLVSVRIEHKLLLTGNRQKREHVAAREGSDERFLGIDIGGIAG